MAVYEVALVLVALAIFSAIILPRWFSDKPLSFPILYVALGLVLFSLPIGVEAPNPLEYPAVTERLTELVIIIALMGAGLKIDRPFDWRAWLSTWRLLGVTMPLTIAATALLGWGVLGLLLPTAVLMGAVIAPTDPVLASDVQTSEPTEEVKPELDPAEQEEPVRFALTSEAGLNDGLAFPFTYLAIALASVQVGASDVSDPTNLLVATLLDWLLVDVGYKIVVGVLGGYVVGKVVAYLVFGSPSTTELAEAMEGAEALAATFFAYGLTELAGGYGFIAVFVAALVLRDAEWTHEYYRTLADFAVMVERLLLAAVLVLFGGAIAGGLLDPLTLRAAAVGLAILFVVRPLAGIIGLAGGEGTWKERAAVATFGIRGIGSFFYLAYALHEATFQEFELLIEANTLWALTGFIVLTSMVVHGVTATPVMNVIEEAQRPRRDEVDAEVD